MPDKAERKLASSSIKALLRWTNLDTSKFPWNTCRNAPRVTKRWDTLPVTVENPTQDSRVTDAIRIINEALCPHVVNVPVLVEGVGVRANNHGIVISIGSAVGGPGQPRDTIFGNVSAGPSQTGFPRNFVQANGAINTVLCLNLDSMYIDDRGAPVKVGAEVQHVVHEFGHALGLGDHFDGFAGEENDHPIDVAFWSVLATLYNTPVGSVIQAVKIPSCISDDAWVRSLYPPS